ncbi:MAG: cellobiose phosphorylase [Candidatus Margulisiibacteriota bacterium]|jgi:hypothetical protein
MPVNYRLKDDGTFIIENYNFAKSFSSFLPGIAGLTGKPLWCFYVNRGQGICSFGVENRDNPIMEFFPANQAYQFATQIGFRTFYKIANKENNFCTEAFKNIRSHRIKQEMQITSYDVSFEERNFETGLLTKVTFFTLPNTKFPGLVRKVSVTNIGTEPKKFEILDGLPKIMPFGMIEFFCKNMSRTSEAWMGVTNLEENFIPFYKLKVLPLDEAKVKIIEKGNFFLCLDDMNQKIKPIVDPTTIFGSVLDFNYPENFFKNAPFIFPQKQITDNKTPSAFIHYALQLNPGESRTFYQLIGQTQNLDSLNELAPKITDINFFLEKEKENKQIIFELQNNVNTVTNSKEFDYYVKQTFLDNVLRGGFPYTLAKDKTKSQVFYLYSRKHGDIERDYNQFNLNPTYFSDGNGNYRDVNQNRRSDLFFNLDIQKENIIQMLNLLQLDGYNPLVIKGKRFFLTQKEAKVIIRKYPEVNDFLSSLTENFSPGELYEYLENKLSDISLILAIFHEVILKSEPLTVADHGEGFWSDHWTYNLDLIKSYLSIFPDHIKDLFLADKSFTYYDDIYYVLPRNMRYGLNENGEPRQIKFISKDDRKVELLAKRMNQRHQVRIKQGVGEIYHTNLTVKLLSLILVKACTLDSAGLGIEMEAGKPNWYDAINGLPSLFGSASSETFELIRLAQFLINNLSEFKTEKVKLPIEIMALYKGLQQLVVKYLADKNKNEKDFVYWEKANRLKENFRKETILGLDGHEEEIKIIKVIDFLSDLVKRIEYSLAFAKDSKTQTCFTYFAYKAESFIQDNKTKEIKITKFTRANLPLFLEGPVHKMKLVKNEKDAFKNYLAVKGSLLFDSKLQLYKVNSSLQKESIEIGRTKIFTPGWLENESIWLHMAYKYLLEILKSGLNIEFENNLKNCLIAFRDPFEYGRSILENSSFIASSANPDPSLHGQGFVARLSGSTAEFVQIWITMFFGKAPFQLDQNQNVVLKFEPKIPAWLFTNESKNVEYFLGDGTLVNTQLPENAILVNFLGKIPVIFHNPSKKNTWDLNIRKIIVLPITGPAYEVTDSIISNAEFIREQKVKQLDVFF